MRHIHVHIIPKAHLHIHEGVISVFLPALLRGGWRSLEAHQNYNGGPMLPVEAIATCIKEEK